MAGRMRLIEMMPYANVRADATGDYRGLLEDVFQPALGELLVEVDRFKLLDDVDRVDVEAALDAMLYDLGCPFETASLDVNLKRRLIRTLLAFYRLMGTETAIRDVIALLTEYEVVRIISPSVVDAWDLGVDVLGDGVHPINPEDPSDFAVIGPSARFMIFSFSIELDRPLAAADEPVIRKLVRVVKPAYMHFLGIVQPPAPEVVEHWEIGYSEVDVNTNVH